MIFTVTIEELISQEFKINYTQKFLEHNKWFNCFFNTTKASQNYGRLLCIDRFSNVVRAQHFSLVMPSSRDHNPHNQPN